MLYNKFSKPVLMFYQRRSIVIQPPKQYKGTHIKDGRTRSGSNESSPISIPEIYSYTNKLKLSEIHKNDQQKPFLK